MKATLEIFWGDGCSRYDNLPDSIALSSARIAALSGGHAKVCLSDGILIDYISDNADPRGYWTVGPI